MLVSPSVRRFRVLLEISANRESGENPELPRSGKRERKPRDPLGKPTACLKGTRRGDIGKEWPVGVDFPHALESEDLPKTEFLGNIQGFVRSEIFVGG